MQGRLAIWNGKEKQTAKQQNEKKDFKNENKLKELCNIFKYKCILIIRDRRKLRERRQKAILKSNSWKLP